MMQNFRPSLSGAPRGAVANFVVADVYLDNHSQGRGYSSAPFLGYGQGGALTPNVVKGKTIVGLIQNLYGFPPGVALMAAGDASLPFSAIRVPGMNGGALLRIADADPFDDGTIEGVRYWQWWWFAVSGTIVDGPVLFR